MNVTLRNFENSKNSTMANFRNYGGTTMISPAVGKSKEKQNKDRFKHLPKMLVQSKAISDRGTFSHPNKRSDIENLPCYSFSTAISSGSKNKNIAHETNLVSVAVDETEVMIDDSEEMQNFISDSDAAASFFAHECGWSNKGNCRIYETYFDVAELRDGQLMPTKVGSLSRKRHRTNSTNNSQTPTNGVISAKQIVHKLTLSFNEYRSFQSDYTPTTHKTGGPFQKVVRFSLNGAFLITGGTDGHFRVWESGSYKKLLDHNAHKDDIDDLDCSPDGSRLVTVGRDCCGYVWQTKDAAKLVDLSKENGVLPTKYRFRFARFAPALCTKRNQVFFTVAIPVVRSSKKQSCFVTRWIINDQNICRASVHRALNTNEVVSAFALSSDGLNIAMGTLGGSLIVLDASSLMQIKIWPEAHGIFVTSLDFLPSNAKYKPESSFCPLMSNAKCAFISVSADDCGQLHVVPADVGGFKSSCLVIMLILFWVFIFYLLVFLEL